MRLRIIESNQPTDTVFEIDKPITTIGRDDTCDVCVKDVKISRVHCEIILEDTLYVLLDRHSTNGTFVNNQRIVHHMLEFQDLLKVGNILLRVEESAKASEEIKWSSQDSSEISFSIPIDVIQQKMQVISQKAHTIGTPRPAPSVTMDSDMDLEIEAPSAEEPVHAEERGTVKEEEIRAAVEREINNAPKQVLRKLEVLYQTAEKLSRLSSLEELYDWLCEKIFDVFTEIEYLHFSVCADGSPDLADFRPIRFVSREQGQIDAPLEISHSLFERTIETRSGILAKDAVRDERFDKSSSIARLNIRSVMCVPLISVDKAIGILYADNRSIPDCFAADDLELFSALASQFAVALDKLLLLNQLQKGYHETMLALINAIEAKDEDTMGHTQRVRQYALGIAREMGLPSDRCSKLQTAAMLHDIGKIGISQNILGKSGSLSDTEYNRVQNHVEMGVQILRPIGYLAEILPIIRGHHEKYDGSGYPDGLAGADIPKEARILALADAVDAMTAQRVYNKPISKTEAIQRCIDGAGTQFDPEVVEAFKNYSKKFELITAERTSFTGRPVGAVISDLKRKPKLSDDDPNSDSLQTQSARTLDEIDDV